MTLTKGSAMPTSQNIKSTSFDIITWKLSHFLSDYFHHDILQFHLPAVCFLALTTVSQSLHILRSGEGDFIGLITDMSNSPVGVLYLA